MFSGIFVSQYAQYKDRVGQHLMVLRSLTDEERDPEVGCMYRIRFDDGTEIDAWPEEILPWEEDL